MSLTEVEERPKLVAMTHAREQNACGQAMMQ